MLLIISPAKILNFKPQTVSNKFTIPEFIEDAQKLMNELQQFSAIELANILGINIDLATINVDRNANWHTPFTPENAKQAVFSYDGEVYRGLNAKTFEVEDIEYMQKHLRLFSGLYGILRPLDLIQPYRLEISSKLKLRGNKDLYDFWSNKIIDSLNNTLDSLNEKPILLNLSSNEYIKAVSKKNLNAQIINFEFMECVNDKYKSIVVYIKKARGMMAQYVIKNRINNTEDLKGFNMDGYWYNEKLSSEFNFVFTRG